LYVKPERLNVLEFGSQEPLEVVLDDEDAKEIRVTPRAEDVPGQCRYAETDDCCWV
jgi:hypothetical protein